METERERLSPCSQKHTSLEAPAAEGTAVPWPGQDTGTTLLGHHPGWAAGVSRTSAAGHVPARRGPTTSSGPSGQWHPGSARPAARPWSLAGCARLLTALPKGSFPHHLLLPWPAGGRRHCGDMCGRSGFQAPVTPPFGAGSRASGNQRSFCSLLESKCKIRDYLTHSPRPCLTECPAGARPLAV